MQRRELLETMINTALAWGLLGFGSRAQAHPHACSTQGLGDAASLQQQMQYWARYDGSELGVPMLLGLENLAAADAPPRAADSLNQQMAALFEQYVDLLLQFKPEPDESDVAALLVLLAEPGLIPDAARSCA